MKSCNKCAGEGTTLYKHKGLWWWNLEGDRCSLYCPWKFVNYIATRRNLSALCTKKLNWKVFVTALIKRSRFSKQKTEIHLTIQCFANLWQPKPMKFPQERANKRVDQHSFVYFNRKETQTVTIHLCAFIFFYPFTPFPHYAIHRDKNALNRVFLVCWCEKDNRIEFL